MLKQTITTAIGASAPVASSGGLQTMKADGTWGSGTLTLTWCEVVNGTYVAIGSGVALSTSNPTQDFLMPPGWVIATLTGSSSATISWGIAPAVAGVLPQIPVTR